MTKRHFNIILSAALGLSFALSQSGAVEIATADGTIVSSDTLLDVRAIPPILTVATYLVPEKSAKPVALQAGIPSGSSNLIWGYEAAFGNSRLLSYRVDTMVTPGAFCVPDAAAGGPTGNGRGVAFDPVDGNLWMTRLTNFAGDGFIHKVSPPSDLSGVCSQVDVIPFGDGPGGTIQDDIGALDVDEQTRHIWAAGYAPINVGGELRSYLYLVNRNSGSVIKSCWVPFGKGGIGNDTLTYARLTGVAGSGQYLLTDAGGRGTFDPEDDNHSNLLAVDTASCKNGQKATVVARFSKNEPEAWGAVGADFEWPGLLVTENTTCSERGDQPFSSSTDHGPWGNTETMEDLSLCAFRALFGGTEDDMCPY